jgi:DNA repair protein RadD
MAVGVPHGIIQAGHPMALQRPVQVASIQTLMRRPDALSHVDLIVVDECHHVTQENTYSDVLRRFPSARVVGVTATPWRLDGRGLADVFDGHVIAATPRELRDQGFLVPVGGWEYEGIDTDNARVKGGDYVQGDLQTSATSAASWATSSRSGRKSAAGSARFCSPRPSSTASSWWRSSAGWASQRSTWTARCRPASETRSSRAYAAVRRRWCATATCSPRASTARSSRCVILARPTLSTSLYLQMVGRGLRPAPGKTMARIHDHAGCLAAHGHPFADRDYSPENSSRGDRKKAEEKAAVKRRCAACKSVIARWPCDACGYSPNPEELKREYEAEAAAAKREITNDGTAPKRQTESDAQRKEKWIRRYEFDDDRAYRREFFFRMVAKHGVSKGAWVYRWVSGNHERPLPEWMREAEQQMGATA